jgi:hypothetical protein
MKRERSNRRIFEFVAAGPKNYAYKHSSLDGQDIRAELKIRGITLTYETAQLLNFDRVRDLVFTNFQASHY